MGKQEKEEGVGKLRESLSSYIGCEYQTPPSSLKTRLFPRGCANGTLGLPKTVLIKTP